MNSSFQFNRCRCSSVHLRVPCDATTTESRKVMQSTTCRRLQRAKLDLRRTHRTSGGDSAYESRLQS